MRQASAYRASALTGKDAADLRFGLALGVDLVAMSFVQTAGDVEAGLAIMRGAGRTVPLIAKIERTAAVDNIDQILQVASGVMVARGDLGLEMPLEQARACRSASSGAPAPRGFPRFSRRRSSNRCASSRGRRAPRSATRPMPSTRGRTLSCWRETAVGAYPVRARADARRRHPRCGITAVDRPHRSSGHAIHSRHGRALCEAAVTLAATAQADAIVAVTRAGQTARLLSALRPATPVVAATASRDVVGACKMLWGVAPLLTPAREVAELAELLLSQDRRAAVPWW